VLLPLDALCVFRRHKRESRLMRFGKLEGIHKADAFKRLIASRCLKMFMLSLDLMLRLRLPHPRWRRLLHIRTTSHINFFVAIDSVL
jgi:hypothetical protein